GGALSGSFDGGQGDDALIADNTTNTWTIDGVDSGTLNGQAFTSIENLVGGSHGDTFAFMASGEIRGTVDGGADDEEADPPPVDTFDYSQFPDPLTINLDAGTLPQVNDHAEIDAFVGTSAADTILGPGVNALVWTITGPDEVEVAELTFEG